MANPVYVALLSYGAAPATNPSRIHAYGGDGFSLSLASIPTASEIAMGAILGRFVHAITAFQFDSGMKTRTSQR